VARETDRIEFSQAFVKGLSLAQYRYAIPNLSAESPSLTKLVVLSKSRQRDLSASTRRGLVAAEYTARARDLVNAPANLLTPAALAETARRIAREHGLTCRVMGPGEIRKRKMGAILGVARGSREEPRFIVLEYNRARKRLPLVCLVGKGVTFDSGGLSLKPWERMNEMKGDMAGAAVVINAVAAAERLRLPLRIAAVVPALENMPDGAASRPGDVVTTYAGKTVEILSTDAEGRLVLADGITYVRKHYRPAVVVDFATLTGAVMIALGTRIAAVLGNDQSFVARMIAAGERAGEPVWQLPLDQRFYDSVKGDITDFKNYSGRNGGAITAAALLGKFAGSDPWVHVDIAGTFWNDGSGPLYQAKGATGYGVDLALRFLEDIASGA
jgi:leucyl aminopeptidase